MTDVLTQLVAAGTARPVNAEAAARLLNGAALDAALWIGGSDDPQAVKTEAVKAFRVLAEALLAR